MSIDSSDVGFQVDTLARLPKKHVIFEAFRENNYSAASTVIPYEKFSIKFGEGMDLESGVFVAPAPGIYRFTLRAADYSTNKTLVIEFRKNGETRISGIVSELNDYQTIVSSIIVELDMGETIDTYLVEGTAHGNDSYQIVFGGYLVYPKEFEIYSK
jgi:hypothetical protein